MATVPHSRKTTDAIKENATAPFNKTMKEVTQRISEDDQLLRLINIDKAGIEQTDFAEKLYKLNPDWFFKHYSNISIHIDGRSFAIECTKRPSTSKHGKNYLYNFNEPEKARGPVFQRFMTLYAPFKRALDDKNALELAIEAVVEATPNLQRAVEVMPALVNWMPDEVRKRYNAPAAPKAAKRASAEDIKASALTPEALAAMARARMSE